MTNRQAFLAGLGIGLGLTYFVDPRLGHNRRRRISARIQHNLTEAADALSGRRDDVIHRAYGRFARLRARMTADPASDVVLAERVRAEMGHVVSHAHAIQVSAAGGQVRLAGSVRAEELGPLLDRVASVPGIRGIDNQLRVLTPI